MITSADDNRLRKPGENNQPSEAEFEKNADKVCMDCGKVISGPHAGETISEPSRTASYKGVGISHSLCTSCYDKRIAAVRHRRE